MEQFFDENGCTVQLVFKQQGFEQPSRHVLVLCRFVDKWLLTAHKERGWEFPGGKIEVGESAEQAAIREVFEETGGLLETFFPLGEYRVSNGRSSFVKTIFFGSVKELIEKNTYLETDGPVFEDGNILETRFQPKYSYIMKDDVIKKSIEYLDELSLLTNKR
ncbi:RNA deprotection pyrophosphohydrolase [Bacillus sp. T3]|uniref:RNA deprotection pyrophosphohydrolase n=1 Tax=Bacillus sp. T3 TaxID=467262 RepID=UPI002981B64D|nr:nucleoside triphosphatase YtkD [Bacillus sp. T3]